METIKKKDFVEIKFTGYHDEKPFDSNIVEDLKEINSEAKAEQTIVAVGEGMLVPGFDAALEGKEIGKEYKIEISAKEGFGERKRELMKTIPLKVFTDRRVYPKAGMVLNLDNAIARIIAVSGARVITDFNNPLAGKDIEYKFTIVRKVDDEKEKCDAFFKIIFRFAPEYEISDKVYVIGSKNLEMFVNAYKEKFKALIGKELAFKEKEEKKAEIKPDADIKERIEKKVESMREDKMKMDAIEANSN